MARNNVQPLSRKQTEKGVPADACYLVRLYRGQQFPDDLEL